MNPVGACGAHEYNPEPERNVCIGRAVLVAVLRLNPAQMNLFIGKMRRNRARERTGEEVCLCESILEIENKSNCDV